MLGQRVIRNMWAGSPANLRPFDNEATTMTVQAPDEINGDEAFPLLKSAFQGLCPQCGAKTLFAGPTKFADRCSSCGLDYTQFNVGDGPAAFLTLVLGALITALALTVEITLKPPMWLHMLLWIPLTAILVLYGLRMGKAALLIQEHRKKAAEGQIETPNDGGEG